jgi:ankyrin repeat protein
MTRPDELKRDEPLLWSPGTGIEVWNMFCAAIAGDVEVLRQLVAKNPALVRCHYAYRTPLYFAVRENRVDAARFLLDNGTDPMALAVNGTPLEIARDRGYHEMEAMLTAQFASKFSASTEGNEVAAAIRDRNLDHVRELLDAAPHLLHAGDEHSNQPIHWAVMTRQPAIIDELVRRGADLNARRADGAIPLYLFNGDYNYRGWRDVPEGAPATPAEVLDHLIARGATIDLWTASHMGNVERVRELLDQDPTLVNRDSGYRSYYLGCGSPLRNAVARGRLDVVQLLLDRGADPNLPEEGIAPKGHALYSAVYNGHYEIAKLLLERGAYPSPPVESSADALSIALSHGNKEMIDLLVSYGSARSVELLAHYNDLQTAAAVFAANPSLADDPSAFGSATGHADGAFVRLMLRYQTDLASRVSLAAASRELTLYLFSRGMNPSRGDWLGITPLHQFAKLGDVENAALFLDQGADIHARDEDLGSTPLAWAARSGQLEMVKLLLDRGSKRRLPDDPPWAVPVEWARRRGHEEIAALCDGD